MSRSLEDIQRDEFLASAESLAQLVQHPAWPVYEDLLVKMRMGAMELMAATRSQRQLARCQGAIAILQELLIRPHHIMAAAQEIGEAEAQLKKDKRKALDYVAAEQPLEDDL